jgi:hypothetical protein
MARLDKAQKRHMRRNHYGHDDQRPNLIGHFEARWGVNLDAVRRDLGATPLRRFYGTFGHTLGNGLD